MKKFRVQFQEICTYSIDVEAEDEEEAEENARDILINTEDRDQYFISCEDRDTVYVDEDPPNWNG